METSLHLSDRLKLRKASQDDMELAFLVKRAAFRKYAELVWGWDEDGQRQLHDRRFREQDYRIINLDGNDIGVISMDVKPDCVFVNQIYVLPEHQGQGVGWKCMQVILERGRDLGLTVRLQVLKVNPRAVAFYERLGFTITDETDTHFLMQSM